MKENKNTPIWKYFVALLVLWASPLIISVITSLILSISNFFIPRIYARGVKEIVVLSNAVGSFLSCYFANIILEEKHEIFCIVNCSIKIIIHIFAIYCALITPAEYREAYYGSIAFAVSYGISIFFLSKNRKDRFIALQENKSEFPTS